MLQYSRPTDVLASMKLFYGGLNGEAFSSGLEWVFALFESDGTFVAEESTSDQPTRVYRFRCPQVLRV